MNGESDERATNPPSEEQPEHEPGEGEPEPDPGESPGPLGNPANDEEALANRQQDD